MKLLYPTCFVALMVCFPVFAGTAPFQKKEIKAVDLFKGLSGAKKKASGFGGFMEILVTDDGYMAFILHQDIKKEYLKPGQTMVVHGDPSKLFGKPIGNLIEDAALRESPFYVLHRGNVGKFNADRMQQGFDPLLGLCSGGTVGSSAKGGQGIDGIFVSSPCGSDGGGGGGGGCRQGVSPPSMGGVPNWMSGFYAAGDRSSQASRGGSGENGGLPDQSSLHDGDGGSSGAGAPSGGSAGQTGGSAGSGGSSGSGQTSSGGGQSGGSSGSPGAAETEREFEGVSAVSHETSTVDGNQVTIYAGVAIEPNGDYTLSISFYEGAQREENESPFYNETHIGNTHDGNAERTAAIEHIMGLAGSGQGRIERTRQQQQQLCDSSDSGCTGNHVILTAFPFTTPSYVRTIARQFGSNARVGGRGPDCRDPNGACGGIRGGHQPGVNLSSGMMIIDPLGPYINPGSGESISDGDSGTGSVFGGRSSCTPPLIAVPKNFWALDCEGKTSLGSCDNARSHKRALDFLFLYRAAHPAEQEVDTRAVEQEVQNAGRGR